MDSKDNSKVFQIIIAVLLVLAGVCIGYIVGIKSMEKSNNNQVDKKINDNYQKENENQSEETEEQNSTEKQNENQSEETEEQNSTGKQNSEVNSLESKGTKESVEISLNGKNNTLTLLDGTTTNERSYLTFGNTNLMILKRYGTGPAYEAGIFPMPITKYKVVIGKDNKEYLIVYYDFIFEHALLVINDSTKIIGKYFNENGCGFATLEDIEKTMTIIENDDIYYYKPIETSNGNSSKLELTKLEIENDTIKEVKTNTVVTGKMAQCT